MFDGSATRESAILSAQVRAAGVATVIGLYT